MAEITDPIIEKSIATAHAPTYVVLRTADGPVNPADGIEVSIENYNDDDAAAPIRVATTNSGLLQAASGNSAAYGIGARLTPSGARQLAEALVRAADEFDAQAG